MEIPDHSAEAGAALIAPPATALAAEVRRLLDQCPTVVAEHSERSYQFAAGLAAADGVELDDEVLYLGTVLHDVGLSPAAAGTERFEMRGANLVRALLLDHGLERERVANVWDCIALHASTAIARHKSPETRYANLGISLDLRNGSTGSMAPEFVRAVLDRWPRHRFPTEFEAVLIDEVRAHPDSVRLSWLESVAVSHIPGYTATDLLAGLRGSRDFV